MRKGLKKAAVLGLSAGLALTSVAGCSKKDKFDAEAAAITVNDATVSAGVLNLAVRYNQAGYESMYMSFGLTDPFNQDLTGMGTTIGMDLKTQLATEMTHALLAEQKMSDYNVSISDEDKEKIKTAAAGFIAANEEEVLKEMGVTQEIAERYLELITIQSRVEREMCADVDTEVSDEEAAQRKVQYVLFTPESETESEAATEAGTEQESAEDTTEKVTEAVTEAQEDSETETEAQTAGLTENTATKTQTASETETEAAETENKASETETEAGETEKAVTASADGETEAETKADGTEAATENSTEAAETEAATEAETETEDPETAAAKERARVHAAEMIEKVKAGGDFEETATEMGKTASTTTFGADYSLTELVAATDGLADDTLVETPVETANGYYVVKLVSQLDRDATDNAKTNIVNQRKNDRISELYTEWTEAGKVSIDTEVLAKITFDYHLVLPEEEPETSAEEETEAKTEAGTEAKTETESATEAKTEADTEKAETETEAAVTEANAKVADTEADTEAADTEAATEADTEAKDAQTESKESETSEKKSAVK